MRKLRMTNQRQILLQELKKQEIHPTADELYEIVRKKMPRISLATVYRNLELLSEAGYIGKLEIGGRQKRFDGRSERHNHICCSICHRVDNLEVEPEVDIWELSDRKGYEITGYRLEITGICPECQKKQKIGG